MKNFNLLAQLKKELGDFHQNKIDIANVANSGDVRHARQNNAGYQFSQNDTVNLIDLYYNSKFQSGEYDSEGQRKVFLNIGKFRADVAAKQTDLDVKDFVFVPEKDNSVWGAYFLGRRFKQWAKENYFGKLINQLNSDYSRYGSAVVKVVGEDLERVPIRCLKNQQDATDLQSARYVIEEHKDMTLDKMERMSAWDLSGVQLDFDQTVTVYERYGRVPLDWYKKQKDMEVEEGDDRKSVDTMSILVFDTAAESDDGSILFLEKIGDNERPYREVHWSRQDGRWLGIGEIENQFENQLVRNLIANLERRALLWSSKKIFQSPDSELPKNLVRDVKDGDVMQIMPGGNITQVDMSTRSFGEFQAAANSWDRNSDQKSFTFEVATGESLPSGTPFRLGVLLSNASNSHFALKRENLGLFFKEVINELLLPVFKKNNSEEHTITLFSGDEGVETLKKIVTKNQVNKTAREQLLSGVFPDLKAIEAKIVSSMEEKKQLFMTIPDNFYDEVEASVDLVITGESLDLPKRIETLTTTYNVLAQQGDPRASKVLEKLLALTGENVESIAGPAPAQEAQGGQIPNPAQIEQALETLPAV